MVQKLLQPTLTMRSKLPDNVTSQIDDLVSRVRLAKDDKESAEIARQFAGDLQERINSERLEAASRLAAWLAHRINNPLGAISGNAQLLARRLERDITDPISLEAYLRYTDAIRNQIERCASITNELLDFTRPVEPDIQLVDLFQIVEEAADLAGYGMSGKVEVIIPEDFIQEIRTDRELLVRALFELIRNAHLAIQEDGTVTVGLSMPAQDRICISVSDTGQGIPEDILPRVFEPFFSTREKAKGLGLTRSLYLMQELGGSVEIAETGEDGTTVLLHLPVGGPAL